MIIKRTPMTEFEVVVKYRDEDKEADLGAVFTYPSKVPTENPPQCIIDAWCEFVDTYPLVDSSESEARERFEFLLNAHDTIDHSND